jgi:hypothetical protein
MIGDSHDLGLRVLLDIVPNHLSDQHPWFQQALVAGPGSRERDRFIFRTGRGPAGPPTIGRAVSAAPRGHGSPRPRGVRDSGTCICSLPSSLTSTGAVTRSERSSTRRCASGSISESMDSASTWPTASSKRRGFQTSDRPRGPHPANIASTIRTGTETKSMRSTEHGARSPMRMKR